MNEQVAPSQVVAAPLAGSLWLWWLGAHLGGGLITSLFFALLAGSGDWSYILGVILIAGIMAVVQGWVLHRFLPASFSWPFWVVVTLLGLVIGGVILTVGLGMTALFSAFASDGGDTNASQAATTLLVVGEVVAGILAGAVLAVAQMPVLAPYLHRARALLWVVATSLGLTLALLIATFVAVGLNTVFASWLVFTGVFGLLTGLVLQWLLRAAPAPA